MVRGGDVLRRRAAQVVTAIAIAATLASEPIEWRLEDRADLGTVTLGPDQPEATFRFRVKSSRPAPTILEAEPKDGGLPTEESAVSASITFLSGNNPGATPSGTVTGRLTQWDPSVHYPEGALTDVDCYPCEAEYEATLTLDPPPSTPVAFTAEVVAWVGGAERSDPPPRAYVEVTLE